MTYDWVRMWWEFYGGAAELRLFVFFSGRKVEAVVPIYISTLGLGALRFRVARLVGANIPPKVFDPPVPHSCAAEVVGLVVDQLFDQEACDLLSFGPISESHPVTECVEAVCAQRASLTRKLSRARGVYSVFHVPDCMEAYYASLSKNERKNRRKYELRLLQKDYDAKVHVERETAKVRQEFESFAKQHAAQWAAEGKSGHFGAWPRALEYNRALVKVQGEAGRSRFIRILANSEVIANQYVFSFGDRYFWELPSRAVDRKWERYSLGPTGIVTMIGEAIKEGISTIEGGLAHYDYKMRLGAKEYSALTFRIVSSKPGSHARLALFSLFRGLACHVYHKLWYRRLMPRTPRMFWQPQSNRWLRLDF